MNEISKVTLQCPTSVRQAAREFADLFNLEGRIGKNASGLSLRCVRIGDVSHLVFTVFDTSIVHDIVLHEATKQILIQFALRLMGTVITTQPYRDVLCEFIKRDWLHSIQDRRVFNTIELRLQEDRVLFVVKGSSESPIYGMCYNTILEH